jgi:hypothetical protein
MSSLGSRLVAAVNKRAKPEGMDAAAWTARRNALLARGYFIAGTGFAGKNDWTDADKNLRAAVPLLAGSDEELGRALYTLGLSDYYLSKQTMDRTKLADAVKYSEQASKLKSSIAQQAWSNAHLFKDELDRTGAHR